MIPHNALSFAYHITLVAPYREELHTDLRESIRRFEIEKEFHACFAKPDAEVGFAKFHQASAEIERAAFAGRDVPKAQLAAQPLKVPMAKAATNFFSQVGDLLSRHTLPDGEPDPSPLALDETLLHCVYLLFHSSVFRQRSLIPPSTRVTDLQKPQAFIAAWQAVQTSLQAGTGANAQAVASLMEGLAVEYSHATDPIWQRCW
jgi:hypothetical protein